MNPAHPHTYPVPDRFRVLREYLPGTDSFNDTGVELSERVPMPGEFSLLASADWLQGDSFHPGPGTGAAPDPRAAESRPAVLGRLSGFAMLGERSGLELGLDAVQGTNNVAASTRTRIFGADAKTKLWNSASSYLLLQGEGLLLDREEAAYDSVRTAYTSTRITPFGAYFMADYNFRIRYDAGASYERYQQPTPQKSWDQAFQLFAGLSLMEETTAFRLSWEHFVPGPASAAAGSGGSVALLPGKANTVTLRVIYSMGPHKAHQF